LDVSLMDPQVQVHPLRIKAIFRQEPIIQLDFGCTNAFSSGGALAPNGKSMSRQEHVLWGRCIKIVARNVNRRFIGTQLCRYSELINNMTEYAMVFILQRLALATAAQAPPQVPASGR